MTNLVHVKPGQTMMIRAKNYERDGGHLVWIGFVKAINFLK